jgi:tetratricopeptide (TPR) repeat protein
MKTNLLYNIIISLYRLVPKLIVSGILFILPGQSKAALVPEEEFQKSERCILDCRYDDAEKILDTLIQNHSTEPAGYILKAAFLQYWSSDYENHSRDREFLSLLEKAETFSNALLKANPKDLWAHYFLYAAESMKGAKAAASGHLVSGIKTGRSGAKGMEWILSEDNSFYDACFMTGCYRFWKSTAMRRVNWIPFVGDDRKRGIEEVQKAAEKGKLTGPLSATMLLQMLVNYNPPAAIELGEKMTAAYPSCRLFAWQLGEAYKKMEKYSEAERVFSCIAESYSRDSADDGSGPLRCWWKLAVLSKSLGKNDRCREYCERIVRLSEKAPATGRQKDRIARAKNMLMELDGGTKQKSSRS